MGQAPKIIKALERTREQVLQEQRDWSLVDGKLQAEPAEPVEEPGDEATLRATAFEVPQQTFD